MTGREAWLGVDVGTQGARAVVVDAAGRLLAVGSTALAGRRVDGRHEQDPRAWAGAALAAVAEAVGCLATAGDGHRIEGVAVDATSGSITLVDPEGEPVAPGLMYDDARAADLRPEVDRVGREQWEAAGYQRMQDTWALPRLLWLLRHRHGGPRRGEVRLAHQADVVTRALIGRPVATDTSTALKTGADAAQVAWPRDVMAALRVPPEVLPGLVLPGTLLGSVGREAAAATGLPAGVPVVAGMTDGCAAQLGAGVTAPGRWNSVLGTTLVLKGVSTTRLADPRGVVYSHRSPTGDWLPGGAANVGAALVAREVAAADLDALSAGAAARLPTAVVRYPLPGRGERFPFVATDARGFVLGEPADRTEALAALLQGTALVERLAYDGLDRLGARIDGPIVLTGGASRNAVWNQVRADVLGRPVARPEVAEPALGMAVLAAAGVRAARTDRPPDVSAAAAAMVRVRETLTPDPARTAGYAAPYRRLLSALEERGWLPAADADHARARIGS